MWWRNRHRFLGGKAKVQCEGNIRTVSHKVVRVDANWLARWVMLPLLLMGENNSTKIKRACRVQIPIHI